MRKQNKITVKFQTFLSAVFFKHFRKNKLKFWSNTQAFISYTLFTCCKTAPTPAIHFLLGELPMEGKVHSDMFSLFFSVWSNPDSKIYDILKYLLSTSSDNSRTWAIKLRHISQMYGMEYSIHPSEVKNGFSEGCPKGVARGTARGKTILHRAWMDRVSFLLI